MSCWRVLAILLLWGAIGASQAQTPESGHSKIERLDVVYRVARDASFEREVEFQIKVNTAAGAQAEARATLDYVAGLQTLEILSAETVKADGRVIPVRPDAITTQDGMVGQVSRPDQKIVSFVFSDLGPGDSKRYRFRLKQLRPSLPGGLYLYERLGENVVIDAARYELHLPADMAESVRAEYAGFKELDRQTTAEEVVRTWTHSNPRIKVGESYAVNEYLNQPHLFVSNAKDWSALAGQYAALHRPKAQVTPKIRQAVAGLVREGMSDEEKLRVLYDWVRKNIRYIALWVGVGNMEPHVADDVLDRRYGDCKDHVVLLEAMLQAVGIDSEPVLIASDTSTYAMPGLATSFAINHVITWVPRYKRYLDSTAATYPYSVLPYADIDKPVLHAYSGNLKRTPLVAPQQRRVLRTTRINLDNRGGMKRETTVAAYGLAAVVAKDWYDLTAGQQANVSLSKELQDQGLSGTATLSRDPAADPAVDGESFSFRVAHTIEEALPDQEVLVFKPAPANAGRLSALDFLRRFTAKNRSSAMACEPLRVDDHYTIHLGEGISVLKLPRERHIDDESGLKMNSTYKLEDGGRRLSMEQSFEWAPESLVCSVRQYNSLRERMRKVLALYDAGLVLQRELGD